MRKIAIVIISMILLASCGLIDAINDPMFTDSGNYEYNSVQAYSTGKDMTQTYYMGIAEEDKKDPFLDAEFERRVESILSDLGYTRSSEYKKGMSVVKIKYKMTTDYEEKRQLRPVYGIKGTETSVDHYGNVDTDVKRGRVGWTTDSYTSKVYDKMIVIAAGNSKTDLRWKVDAHADWGGNDIRRAIKSLVNTASQYVGKNTDGWVKVKVEL